MAVLVCTDLYTTHFGSLNVCTLTHSLSLSCAVALTLPAAYKVSGDKCVLWWLLLLTCPSPMSVSLKDVDLFLAFDSDVCMHGLLTQSTGLIITGDVYIHRLL